MGRHFLINRCNYEGECLPRLSGLQVLGALGVGLIAAASEYISSARRKRRQFTRYRSEMRNKLAATVFAATFLLCGLPLQQAQLGPPGRPPPTSYRCEVRT